MSYHPLVEPGGQKGREFCFGHRPVVPDFEAQPRSDTVGRGHGDGGRASSEESARFGEDVLESGLRAHGPARDPGEVVQHLQSPIALAERVVTPVGGDQGDADNGKKEQGLRIDAGQDAGGHGQAGVASRGDRRRGHQPHRVRPAPVPADHRPHGQSAQGAGGADGHVSDRPAERLAHRVGSDQVGEDDEGRAALGEEQGQVECQLDRGLTFVEDQHDHLADEASDDELDWGGEEQSHYERQLGEREGVGLAVDLDVENEHVRGREPGGQLPPDQVQARGRRSPLDPQDEHGGTHRDQQGTEL